MRSEADTESCRYSDKEVCSFENFENKCSTQRVCARIHLDALEANFLEFHRIAGDRPICAVVKADAYGHGAVRISSLLEKYSWIWGFAVAAVSEALELRNAGITKPILILGYTFPEDDPILIRNDIRAAVFTYERAKALSEAAVKIGKTALFHIALDTGMTRIGFPDTDVSVEEIRKICALPGISLEGLFTHFARADEEDKTVAKAALSRYLAFRQKLLNAGIEIPISHAANSAALLELQEAHLDMIRTGIINYGIYPSDEVRRDSAQLKPVMELISHAVHVKTVGPGVPVSYGGTYVTTRETEIATIPVGYADGYPRLLSNKGSVLIKGKRCPILGRVCMDQMMVDVTGLNVKTGDEVVLMGRQGSEEISADELGALSGRFPYELVCCVSKRVPREYTG